MKLFRFICLALVIASFLGGCNSKKAESDLPDSLNKLNRSATGPILSKELENRLNYERKDTEVAGYIKVARDPVEVYLSPNSAEKKNVYDLERARIRSRKLVNGKEWFYVSAIIVKNPDSLADEGRVTSGWIMNHGDVSLDLKRGTVYDFSREGRIPQKFLDDRKWRLAYSSPGEHTTWFHYIDINSIISADNNIYFSALGFADTKNETPQNGTITNYCYDIKRKMIYNVGFESYIHNRESIKGAGPSHDYIYNAFNVGKGLKTKDKRYSFPGTGVSYSDVHIIRLQDGKTKLAYTNTHYDPLLHSFPNLLYTAFFELLEGK